MTTRTFKDVEVALLDWLKETFPELADDPGQVDQHVGTSPPANLTEALPFVVVDLYGGGDDFFTDDSYVGIDVFGGSRSQSYALSESIRAKLLAPLLVAGGVVVDFVTTRRKPSKMAWDDPAVHRRRAEYEISTRR